MSQNNFDHSRGAMSHMYKRKTAQDLKFLRKLQMPLTMCFAALAIGCLVFASYWSWIVGKADAYTSASGDWENCLIAADYEVLPIGNFVGTAVNTVLEKVSVGSTYLKGNLTNCLLSELAPPFNTTNPPGECSVNCLMDLQADCFSNLTLADTSGVQINVANIKTKKGAYLSSVVNMNSKSMIFGLIVQAVTNYALRHPSWLLLASTCSIFFLFTIWVYYTISPILVTPNAVNSTLAGIVYYNAYPEKFREYNDGDNKCNYARHVMMTNVAFMIGISIVTALTGFIAMYGEFIRYKSPNKKHYTHLRFTELPLFLSIIMFLCYLCSLFAKLTTTITELNAVKDYDVPLEEATGLWFPALYYPFPDAGLDIPTMLGLATVLNVVRGFTIQSLLAFKVAIGLGIAFAVLIYAPLTGAWEFYDYHHFYHYDSCYNYFLDESRTSGFGYPDEGQAKAFCFAARTNLAAITTMFILGHLVAASTIFTVYMNQKDGRESLHHESYGQYETDVLESVVSPAAPLKEPLISE